MRITKSILNLILILSPLYIWRFQYCCVEDIPLPTTFLELLIALLVFFYLVEGGRFKILFNNWRLLVVSLLFLLTMFIQAFVSGDLLEALGIYRAYFLEPLLVFFIALEVITSKLDWEKALAGLIIGGLWISILSVWQVLTGTLVFASHEISLGRGHGVFNTANAVGLFVGPIVSIVMGLLMNRTNLINISWRYAPVILAILIGGILSTKSLGAVIALLVVFVFLVLVKYLNWRRFIALWIGGLILSTALIFQSKHFAPEVDNPWVRPGGTALVRLCLWEGTANLLMANPLQGAGLSGFKEKYSREFYTCDAEPLEYPHNLVLNFWSEGGALGLLLFLILTGYIMRRVYVRNSWISYGIIGAFVYTFTHGLVDVAYFKNDLALMYWLIGALGMIYRENY